MTKPPLDVEELSRVSLGALELGGGDGVEIVFSGSRVGLTRFARSQIIQNTVQSTRQAHVRVVTGRRFAVASTNSFDAGSLATAARRALEAAHQSPEDETFPGLPDPQAVGKPSSVMRFDESTASASPQNRADAVTEILKVTRGLVAAGIYETSSYAYAVMSSAGVNCFDAYTRCAMNVVVESDGSSAYREASSYALGALDLESLARRAAENVHRSVRSQAVGPGRYEVVLEPAAVAVMLEYLSYMGMGAKQVLDGESFLSSRAGDIVARDGVTVADDVRHPLSVGIGFDFEGVPRQTVPVIDEGRATRPVTDLRTSNLLGASLTGHYSGSNEFGPYASNVVMEAGDTLLEDLIGGVDDGLLVSRLHYVNVLDRPATLLTGMTRDGIWRIVRGEIAAAANNLRFTQSVLDTLGSATAVGSELEAFAPDYGGFGSNVAPALRCSDFNFTSATTH